MVDVAIDVIVAEGDLADFAEAVLREGLAACTPAPPTIVGRASVIDGDTIEIDIPNRRIHLAISDADMAARRAAMEAKGAAAWKPANRERVVSAALQAYALMTTSADTGAVRDITQLQR